MRRHKQIATKIIWNEKIKTHNFKPSDTEERHLDSELNVRIRPTDRL